jgi:hypothetical protein
MVKTQTCPPKHQRRRIDTVEMRHGLTRIDTVYNYISLCPLCSLWLKIKYIYSVAKFLFVRGSKYSYTVCESIPTVLPASKTKRGDIKARK